MVSFHIKVKALARVFDDAFWPYGKEKGRIFSDAL
jgi:hypothetical protein